MEASSRTVTTEEVRDLIVELLVEEFDIERGAITDEATMKELDLDSLDMVEIGQVVEQNYGVRIRPKDAEGVTDVGGVVGMIYNKITAADAGGDEESA